MKTKTQNVTMYIYAEKWDYDAEFEIKVACFDLSTSGHKLDGRVIIPLSQVTIEIEVPDVDEKQLQAEEIRQLQERIKQEKIDSHVRVTAIEEKIQSLMAIEVQS